MKGTGFHMGFNFKKAGVVTVLAGGLFAGSIASASFLSVADWFVGGGQFDHLDPVTASDGSISGPLMPGESGEVTFKVNNPNRVSVLVKVTSPDANGVEVTDGPATCAQYVSWKGQGAGYGPEAFRGSVPAHGSVTVHAADWVTIAGDPPANCADAKFKVKFGATAERNSTYAQ